MSPASPVVAQPALWETPAPPKPAHRASRARLRAVPADRPAVRYEPPRLTPDTAIREAHTALTTAGLRHTISRIAVWPTNDQPGHLTTTALLRPGADPDQVHAALTGLPGVVGGHVGQASVSIYRRVTM